MALGILGKKIGMTQIFAENGSFVSVSVVEAGPCPVLAVSPKTVKLGFEQVGESDLKKPQLGLFKKLGIKPQRFIKEVPRDPSAECKSGDVLKVDLFKAGDFVDVSGVSIGKGFQGGMKRWNWSCGPRSHGSMSHRRVGSIGSSADPSRVWKGHHLPGHMGNAKTTVQNLQVIKIDAEHNLLLIKGALPGTKNNYLVIRKAKKRQAVPLAPEAMPTKETKKAKKK